MHVTKLEARSIRDSRGMPTIEVELVSGDHSVCASVPSGKSTGSREATELRDADGGVGEALQCIETIIAPACIGHVFETQKQIDDLLRELDGTENKEKLGANALLPISIAFARAFAHEADVPLWKWIVRTEEFSPSLPRIYANVLNGGVHASDSGGVGDGDFALPFQEYIVVPKEMSSRDAYAWTKGLMNTLRQSFPEAHTGDEGGYAPHFGTIDEPFELLQSLIGNEADLALDAAATSFYDGASYHLLGNTYSTPDLLNIYYSLQSTFYNLISIEDPFAETDVSGFTTLTEHVGEKTLIVGDDLTVTNPRILKEMIARKAGNALIIKPNQIGTLSETYATVRAAAQAGWKCVASHRSGETEDTWIVDIAVAIGAYGIKVGAPTQPERVAKYERLLVIETEITT